MSSKEPFWSGAGLQERAFFRVQDCIDHPWAHNSRATGLHILGQRDVADPSAALPMRVMPCPIGAPHCGRKRKD